MENTPLQFVRGDTNELAVTFDDENGLPIDDTGAIYRMTAKYNFTDSDSIQVFSVTAHQATPGNALIVVPSAATSSLPVYPVQLYYDIKVTETGGRVTTIQRGPLAISPNVTAATS